ncbi:hypothetical protein F9288_14020 [Sphingomonas sp. CL5.1]|uniref:helix-turn-helix transcriptional regulator n=1 Tax=Sphingomonas sp. CL5.1 TaxID=2653203 RepID=UPI00158325A3|nr:hypothetical protein [Sphingomonas sp. CL5.1]QKS00616.1 hypothetical protein F9288_14020 [Sphingomonas sp. CL5.1]
MYLENVESLLGHRRSFPVQSPSALGLGSLIDALGTRDFENELARQLMDMFHSEYIHICHFPAGQVRMINSMSEDGSCRAQEQSAAYFRRQMWDFDPTIAIGKQWDEDAPILTALDIHRPETRELKEFYDELAIGERIVAYGKGVGGHLGLSVVRTRARGAFTGEERARIGLIGEIAFPLLARNYNLLNERHIFSLSLSSLELIENCLALSGHNIPRREAQVIARMLYGMTCEGASIDLSIAFETAVTYKKRFYRRFNLGGFRALLTWYLGTFAGTCHLLGSRQYH